MVAFGKYLAGLFLVVLWTSSCGSPSLSLREELRRGDSLGNLAGMSDQELAVQLAAVEQNDLFVGEHGKASRNRLHRYLVRRLRGQYRFIPAPLWGHLTSGDLTGLFRPIEKQRRQIEPGVLQRFFNGPDDTGYPKPHEKGKPEDRFPVASYRLEGDTVQLDGGAMVLCGQTAEIPPLRYRPPGSGETVTAMAESVLAARLGRPVSLGAPIAAGGMRLVYPYPGKPSLLLKIYDPVRIARIGAKGRIKVPTAVLLAFFLQRDLAVMDILAALRQEFVARGLPPPYELVELAKEPQLLERGIVVQQKVSGLSVWKDLPDQLSRSSLELLDRFFQFHEYFDQPVARFVRSRYDLFLLVEPAEHESSLRVGIDYGRKYSNFFLKKNPAGLVLYDW